MTACTSNKIWKAGIGKPSNATTDATDLFCSNLSQWPAFDDCSRETMKDGSAKFICELSPADDLRLAYPAALSAKLRMYFFCSSRSFTNSATCLMDPTRSTTYADLPLTFSRFIHGVFKIAANAGSQAPSSSLWSTSKQAEMTLKV